MEVYGVIYSIYCAANGKVYIGQATDVNRRWKHHMSLLNSNSHHNIYLQNAWNLHGPSTFEWTIKCECSSREDMNNLEIYYIRQVRDWSFNMTEGGDSFDLTEEVNSKRIQKLREVFKTPDARARRSAINRERYQSQEAREQQSQTLKRVCNTYDIREKRKHFSIERLNNPEERQRLREMNRKANDIKMSVVSLTFLAPDGIVYENIRNVTQFAVENGLDRSQTKKVASGVAKHHRGWVCLNPVTKEERKARIQRLKE